MTSVPSEDGPKFLHRGIAAREFVRTFVLSDDVVVQGADMQNGMLSVYLEHIIPEAKKPRKIVIGVPALTTDAKTLLTE